MNTRGPHPDGNQLAEYQAGRLSAAKGLAVSDHLVDCPVCRAVLAQTAKTTEIRTPGADLPFALADEPPSYEEMAALLDGTLSELQVAEVSARLDASPQATAEFVDLQRFRDQTAALMPKIHGPKPADTGITGAVEPAPGKVVRFPSQRGRSFAALAAAVVVLLSGGWWLTASKSPWPGTPSLWADADLSGLPGDLRRDMGQAAATGMVQVPTWSEELRPPTGALAGSVPIATTFRQIAPVGTVIREDRPTFRWVARSGVSSYVVYLVDKDARAPMLRQEVPGDRTDWTPIELLTRGTVYEWQVEARRGSEIIDRAPRPPAPETRFQVLDRQRATELVQVESRYRQYPLILGTAYARAGLTQAAFEQFTALQHQYPESTVARRLLQESQGRDEN